MPVNSLTRFVRRLREGRQAWIDRMIDADENLADLIDPRLKRSKSEASCKAPTLRAGRGESAAEPKR